MARAYDPLTSFHFQLDLSAAGASGIRALFTEVSGLGSENEVVDHKVVGAKGQQIIKKIPGRLKWGDITLKRGVTGEMDIWQWRQKVVEGKIETARTNGSLILFDQALVPVAQWDFTAAWPSKISGPQIQADGNSFAIEELTLVHEYIIRVK